MIPESKHTPEPWFARDRGIGYEVHYGNPDEHGCGMCVNDEFRECFTKGDADRIVACVNACAGIADPAELRAQRDELLAALIEMRGIWTCAVCLGNHGVDGTCEECRAVDAQSAAAIAKAEGRPA